MKNIVSLLKISLLSLLFVACSTGQKEEDTSISKPSFTVFNLKKDTLDYNLNLPGELKPYDQVTLHAKVEGFISEIKVDRGDEVEKGQVLAVIDAPEIEQQYLAAKSREREILERLNFSQQNFQSLKNASKTEGAVSSIELEQAKTKFVGDSAALSAAKAEVAAAKQLSGYRTITAPFKGIVSQRMVSPGALVGSGKSESLLHIAREDKLRLEVAIPGKHGSSIPLKSTAHFRLNNRPGEIFSAKLSRSSKVLNPELRALMVEFDVDNSEQNLNAGAYVEVDLNLHRSYPTFNVPQSSVIRSRKELYVARIVDERVQLVPITTGVSTSQAIEIFGDLKEGDQIIKKANSAIRDGNEVDIVEEK